MYKLNYFNFKEKKDNYLITNDTGKYMFVDKSDFLKITKNQKIEESLKEELVTNGFIYDGDESLFAINQAMKLRRSKGHLFSPTVLHIFVVTKNCNFNCIYCQAGNLNKKHNYMMSKEIAKKSVDIALESPAKYLNFEFQGGEPLMNFEVIKYIIEYSQEVSKDKIIEYNLVSNLTLLTDEMIDFLIENKVTICTSIDGDKKLQNINRPYIEGDSYHTTVNMIKKLQNKGIEVNAIETTTKYSLDKHKEIIDEYLNLGFNNIFLRPLTRLGKADNNWYNIGYSAEEFLEFFKKSLEYIIEINKKGIFFSENHSSIFLKKILLNETVNYMELRSPCGGAIGQLAYYYDGDIYTCDEGRMLSEMGNISFKLGNVFDNNYLSIMKCDCTKAMCISSCLECLPYCSSCVYQPYCGTCPVVNLAQDNNIFAKNPHEYRCKIYKGILDILFDYIEKDKEVIEIFKSWIM